jgi:hypothetical protein
MQYFNKNATPMAHVKQDGRRTLRADSKSIFFIVNSIFHLGNVAFRYLIKQLHDGHVDSYTLYLLTLINQLFPRVLILFSNRKTNGEKP